MGKYIPSEGVVPYVNPVTKGMAFYLNFELEPNHDYLLEITSDAVIYSPAFVISTKGVTAERYFTYNVSQCGDPWPRITDLGPSK